MKRQSIRIAYSYEHGDQNLPPLKDLASEKADPMKGAILAYLKLHCIAGCPGLIYDELDPKELIGHGHMYSDGTYLWDDVFINYIDKYNIPVPSGFREHILANHSKRLKRHLLLKNVDCVEVHNNPYLGYTYSARINRTGIVEYKNNEECADGAIIIINADDARYIIDRIMTELFCYDSDEHGHFVIDGHHWSIRFLKKNEEVDMIEGWTDEDPWRYHEAKSIFEFIERFIPHELGTKYMETTEEYLFW